MSQKIMYIPLDERPCNYLYPEMIYNIIGNELIKPPSYILGNKKEAADIKQLEKWILNNLEEVEYLVVSIDMLVFGGIIPSRIHHLTIKEMVTRLEILKTIKDNKPEIKIFAFNLITRVPAYNSSDEEPDYYEQYGEQIFKLGFLSDKKEQGILAEKEKEELLEVERTIPIEIKSDYFRRRKKNHQLNKKTIRFVQEGIINFLVFPMDDNSEYGFSAQERRKLIKLSKENGLLNKIYSYPGADEVGSILTVKAFLEKVNYKPRVFLRYSSDKGKNLIPNLEDRSLDLTVKYQVITAGGVVVDNSIEADYILMVNTTSETILSKRKGWKSILSRDDIIDSQRNLHEFVEAIKYYLTKDVAVAVADVAVPNGADDYLMSLLSTADLLDKIASYGAWNTSSNTIGTVVSHASIVSYLRRNNKFLLQESEKSEKFIYLRYLEDWGYQHFVRSEVTKELSNYNLNYFDLANKGEFVAQIVKEKLDKFSSDNLKEFNFDFDVYMPWNRMFEVGIKIK